MTTPDRLVRLPAPQGSVFIYSIVGLSLALVSLYAVSGFYQIDLLRFPSLVVGIVVCAMVAGIVLHGFRKARHRAAAMRRTEILRHLKPQNTTRTSA